MFNSATFEQATNSDLLALWGSLVNRKNVDHILVVRSKCSFSEFNGYLKKNWYWFVSASKMYFCHLYFAVAWNCSPMNFRQKRRSTSSTVRYLLTFTVCYWDVSGNSLIFSALSYLAAVWSTFEKGLQTVQFYPFWHQKDIVFVVVSLNGIDYIRGHCWAVRLSVDSASLFVGSLESEICVCGICSTFCSVLSGEMFVS